MIRLIVSLIAGAVLCLLAGPAPILKVQAYAGAVGQVQVADQKTPAKRRSAQPISKGVEFADFIRAFMLPTGSAAAVSSWNAGHAFAAKVRWKHSGIKSCAKYDAPEWESHFELPFCRAGAVTLMVDGKSTYNETIYPENILEPQDRGPWDLDLMGPRSGVRAVRLVAHGGVSLDEIATSKAGLSAKLAFTEVSFCGTATYYAYFFRVTAADAKDAFLQLGTSCGSGGCSSDLLLSPDEGYMRQYAEKECALRSD
jgi:hypothetical protein